MKLIHAIALAALPSLSAAQHFGYAYIDIRLVPPDSVHVTVQADGLDFKNTVRVFPHFDASTGSGWDSFRLYEQRMASYLLHKVRLQADRKPVALSVVSWKPGGQGPGDGFDTVSIHADHHAITLGGRLPPGTKSLRAISDLWTEQLAFDADGYESIMEYHLFERDLPLRRVRSKTSRWVAFPVEPDSLAAMRKSPLPPLRRRAPTDHTGHNH